MRNRDWTDIAGDYMLRLMWSGKRNIRSMFETGAREDVARRLYQSVQHFITDSPWDWREAMDTAALRAGELLGDAPWRVLAIDETGLAKTGRGSVGVARQYNGRLGKVDVCQVAVCLTLVAGDVAIPVCVRLFMPEEWECDPERCHAAGVPEDLRLDMSKPAMALEMVRHLRGPGVGFDCVCGDGLYGDNPDLVAGLEQDGQLYVLDVHSDMTVWLDPPLDAAGKADGKARRIAARELAAGAPAADWREMAIRCGAAGVIRASTLARRVWTLRGDGVMREGWLLARRELGSRAVKYLVSNAPADADTDRLVRLAARRHFVERGFQNAKSCLGMHQFQVRTWRAWHHHIALVMLAYVLAETVRRLCRDTLPLMSLNDVVFVAVQVRMPPNPDVEDMLGWLLALLRRRHEERRRSMEWKSAHYNANS